MAAMAGILAVYLFPLGLLPAILAVTALCGALGALQGWCIHRLNINSVVFTIGSLIGIRGVTLFISGEKTALIPFDQIEVTDVLSAKLWIFTPLSLCMLAMFFLFEGFAQRTIWGREIFAVGGGRAEARAAGISLRRPTILIFTLSAALAGLAGALLSLKSGSASPLGFDAVLLEAITACLIGGIALSGGRGRILSVLIGLMTIRFLVSGIAALGAPFWAQGLATGALLIFVIAAEAVIRLVAGRRMLLARSPA
jgi:ribose/xylose/arabinose/galactoside ABC-type transport system permease subunit